MHEGGHPGGRTLWALVEVMASLKVNGIGLRKSDLGSIGSLSWGVIIHERASAQELWNLDDRRSGDG